MSELATTRPIAFTEAVLSTLEAHFGSAILTYGAYEPLGAAEAGAESSGIETPALLLELEGFEREPEARERTAKRVALHFSLAVHLLLGIRTTELPLKLAELASDVALVLSAREGACTYSARGNRWGLGAAIEYPRMISAQAEGFQPGLNGVDSWVVRWEQALYLPSELSV